MKLIAQNPLSGAASAKQRRGVIATGFTLIEAAIVTAIIGLGVVAIMQLLATGTMTNMSGTEMTTGMNIAKSIRELSVALRYCDPVDPAHWGPEAGETLATYNDIDDFDTRTFNPPIDAMRVAQTKLAGWEQRIACENVDEDALTVNVPKGTTPAMRVTCSVYHNNKYVCSVRWYVFDTITPQTLAP